MAFSKQTPSNSAWARFRRQVVHGIHFQIYAWFLIEAIDKFLQIQQLQNMAISSSVVFQAMKNVRSHRLAVLIIKQYRKSALV